ncbi:MAG: PadR family transcriptional regulator [Acidobacteriota bacterium]
MAAHAPLKPVDFHLLLALVDGPLHGYALAGRMREESDGQVQMMPGNLYAVIRRLDRQGLVTESEARQPEEDRRRRYFALTDAGRQTLASEGQRMERMANAVRRRLDAASRDPEVTT